MLVLKAFRTFPKYLASPFWFIVGSTQQILLRLLNFRVTVSFRFNERCLFVTSLSRLHVVTEQQAFRNLHFKKWWGEVSETL